MNKHKANIRSILMKHKDTNRKIRTNFFIDYCVSWFQIPSKTCTAPFACHIASDFICVYCTAAGTIFGTTDVYELGFPYLSISVFNETCISIFNYNFVYMYSIYYNCIFLNQLILNINLVDFR